MPASTQSSGPPRRWPQLVFWLLFFAFAASMVIHNTQKNLARDGAALLDTSLDQKVSDHGGFYRCALRMERGELMYFAHHEETRLEMPSKHGRFFALMLRPFLWVGPNWSPIAFDILSFILLAFSLRLAHGLVQDRDSSCEPGFPGWRT